MITEQFAWSPDRYSPQLPPPLCFTVPAGSKQQNTKVLYTGGALKVTLRVPKLMMDPTDETTWQRPYRFTS